MSGSKIARMRALTLFVALASVGPAQAPDPEPPARPKVYPRGGIGERRIPVAVVIYDPVLETEGGRKLSQVMGWQDPDRLSELLVRDVREASGGFVQYEIALRLELDRCPPFRSGFRYDDAGILAAVRTQKWIQGDRASYRRILEENDLLAQIRTRDLHEIWLWGAPGFHWDEYAMHIPRRDERLPPTDNPWFYRPYDIPDVGRTLWIMGFNYERGEGEMLESYGHRCEGILSLAIGGGIWDGKRDDPWNRFTRVDRDHPGGSHVGSLHFAPNSRRDYDWGHRRYVETQALDWRRYPDLTGQKTIMNCDDGWGPDIVTHHKWWLGLLPKAPGRTEHGWNNWWRYVADFDRSGL